MAGTLYIVATPIGNLEDMPPRVAATFGAADFIAAEDTRVTMKLLNFLGLKKPMVSYYEHALQKGEGILRRIEEGENCALCSDAGMPCVSDPGEVIVRDALARGIKVVPIPAASACVTALAVSGQDTSRWVFEGFLPVNRKQKKERKAPLPRWKNPSFPRGFCFMMTPRWKIPHRAISSGRMKSTGFSSPPMTMRSASSPCYRVTDTVSRKTLPFSAVSIP